MNKKGLFGMMAFFIGVMLVLVSGQAFAQAKSNAEYQKIIQSRCKFNNAAAVWTVIDNLPPGKTAYVYQKWAKSYGSNGKRFFSNRPSGKMGTDREIVRVRCGFNQDEMEMIWAAIVKDHRHPDDLKRVWADSYYIER